MTLKREPSVNELRRETERSRAELTSTIVELKQNVSSTADDLKARLSPTHLKREVKDYVREGGDHFLTSVERNARANPLQAVAIGAGLAYPLFGILKTIPVPILLMGAGLWLSRQKAANAFAPGVTERGSEIAAASATKVAQSVREAKDSLAANAEAVTDKVRATAHDIRESVSAVGATVASAVKDKTVDAANTVSETASVLQESAVRLAGQSRNAFTELVDRNPLLTGGLALAVGAFIAASLPASQVENRMFGEGSEAVKDKALGAVAHSVDRAKDLAAGMVGDVAEAAAREGLNQKGLSKAVEGFTDGVKAVVDRGLTTALGAEAMSVQSKMNSSQQKVDNSGEL